MHREVAREDRARTERIQALFAHQRRRRSGSHILLNEFIVDQHQHDDRSSSLR